jgi:hypothetical protein
MKGLNFPLIVYFNDDFRNALFKGIIHLNKDKGIITLRFGFDEDKVNTNDILKSLGIEVY